MPPIICTPFDLSFQLGHVYQCGGCHSFEVIPLANLETNQRGNVTLKMTQGPPPPRYSPSLSPTPKCTDPSETVFCGSVLSSAGLPEHGRCQHCQSRLRLGGPIYIAPMHSLEWVNRALEALEKPGPTNFLSISLFLLRSLFPRFGRASAHSRFRC